MKRLFILILIPLFITGCSIREPARDESVDTNSATNETNSFSQQEADLIRLNTGQSNYSNSVNLKGGVPGKMCYIKETDTLYYSDGSGLFQQTGENTVKLLDTQVMSLAVADGKLYFIIPEGETASVEFGKAFRMDLTNEKTECIIEEDISNLSVYKDRIFYQRIVDFTNSDGTNSYAVQYFKCGLNGEEREQTFDFAFSFEDDKCVTRDGSSIKILDMSDGTSENVIDDPNSISKLSIYNGSLYYIRRSHSSSTNALIRVNLADRTVDEFSTEEYIEDYGFADGKLCVYDLVDFYLEENGTLIKYTNTKNSYKSVYTCGNEVYGLSGEKLYRIGFAEEGGSKTVSEAGIGGA